METPLPTALMLPTAMKHEQHSPSKLHLEFPTEEPNSETNNTSVASENYNDDNVVDDRFNYIFEVKKIK